MPEDICQKLKQALQKVESLKLDFDIAFKEGKPAKDFSEAVNLKKIIETEMQKIDDLLKTKESREPKEFLTEVFDSLADHYFLDVNWRWSISEDGKFVNMHTVFSPADGFKKEFIDEEMNKDEIPKDWEAMQKGKITLMNKFKNKRVRSVMVDDFWYLKII